MEATNPEIEAFYSFYQRNPNHFLCVPIAWKHGIHVTLSSNPYGIMKKITSKLFCLWMMFLRCAYNHEVTSKRHIGQILRRLSIYPSP
jgi:hypothetical protein